MTTISREIEITKSKEEVWNAIAKFGDICHGSPGVLKSHVTSEQQEGVGATRHCDFAAMGASVEERITAWEDGKSLSVEIYEFNKLPGMKTAYADFMVREESGKTILRADFHYSMKNAFFDMMNISMMKKMNIKNWNSVLAGHKKYIETGVIVVKDTPLEFNKVISLN
jgi:hypothetical protein